MPHSWVWLRGARPLWLCRCWVQGAELGRLARIWVVGAVGSWQEQGLEGFSLAPSQRSWVWGTSNTERPHHAHPSPLLHPRCPFPWRRGAAWRSHRHRRQGERSRYVPAPLRTAGSRAVRGPPPGLTRQDVTGCCGALGTSPMTHGDICVSPQEQEPSQESLVSVPSFPPVLLFLSKLLHHCCGLLTPKDASGASQAMAGDPGCRGHPPLARSGGSLGKGSR